MKYLFAVFFIFTTVVYSHAQVISIETKTASLLLKTGDDKKLYQQYFGAKLSSSDTVGLRSMAHQAYITAGTDNLFEPAIRAVHTDGNPSLELNFVSAETTVKDKDVTLTTIHLKDPQYPFEVSLKFEAYYNEDIIKEWTEIVHHEAKEITLTSYASSMLHFDADNYFVTQFHGEWAREMKIDEDKLTNGIKILDSKLGTRADQNQTPVFFLSLNKPSDENSGEVIGGNLAWTGNFRFAFEVDPQHSLRVISGINPYASEYSLAPGKTFITPAFIFSYSNTGKGQISRNFHKWATAYDILDGNAPRLTLLNNWESTFFNFDEQKLTGLFTEAKSLGTDLFLLDDGWFGNKYPRNDDHAGLGDWQENKQKLPHGISYLTKEAAATGVKFGIWMEPEMVNPKSELYEQHPDWILKLPNRPENYVRNQLVLDLTNPQVQDFVYGLVDSMFVKHPGVAYIKWDCNRMLTNTYSPYLKDKQGNLYVDYVRGLYNVLARLRAKYPHIPMMLCSGGGGRIDYEALKYFTEFWASDNTDAVERVYIEWGYTYFFPSYAICSHITSWGKESLKFRTDVAMMGKLGYDIDVSKMSADELTFSKQAVSNYKRISPVIWHGNLYRLASPNEESRAVLMYVNDTKNKAVLFSYNLNMRFLQPLTKIKLQGLDANKKYKVEETNLFPGSTSSIAANGMVYTGDYLMKEGLEVSSNRALTSAIIEITAQD